MTSNDIKQSIIEKLECEFVEILGEDGAHFEGTIVSSLFEGLNRVKQHQLVLLLQQLVSSDFKTTRPPTTFNDLRKIYVTGKHSIYKNIPVPEVIELDNHAYVSVKEIVKYSLSTINKLHLV